MNLRYLLLVLLVGCAGDGGGPKGDTGDGGDDEGDGGDAPWFCDDGDWSYVDGVVETEHYRLYLELDAVEAVEMARLAEASYDAMAAWFGAEPAELVLEAGWYADFAAFQAAVEADGTTAPVAGGYYWPDSRTAYMYTQPNVYYSRMLFIHELVHQFHFLSRTGNQARDAWYVEGLAEYLSRHDWDGRCVRLGRLPTLTWEDAPAQALAEGSVDFDGSADLSRPWAWALTRYLDQEEPQAFSDFRDAYDADPAELLADHVDLPQVMAELEAWLPAQQEPMTPVFYEWIHVTDGVVIGDSPYLTLSITKESERLSVSHDAPVGHAGVLAGYDDSSNYSAWLVGADGGVWTFVSIGGVATWWAMGAVEPAERYTWTVEGTAVELNGVPFVEGNGFAPRTGLAVNGDTVWMEELSL